eukprot:gnl/MRDRNA2_/MRDRNA2_20081_c0_seq1.p1 gnl/MRDRNA2_/MRDRNA2_20081_c0~~gnl/MRDRNA2_/MRDRNA2_20081_c0_seq1.p1  ORF type:complete len:223 (-),score=39.71 gnl/MRDRNA2_/MRDRNA2_20081_c0_seq1:55-678(-)
MQSQLFGRRQQPFNLRSRQQLLPMQRLHTWKGHEDTRRHFNPIASFVGLDSFAPMVLGRGRPHLVVHSQPAGKTVEETSLIEIAARFDILKSTGKLSIELVEEMQADMTRILLGMDLNKTVTDMEDKRKIWGIGSVLRTSLNAAQDELEGAQASAPKDMGQTMDQLEKMGMDPEYIKTIQNQASEQMKKLEGELKQKMDAPQNSADT